MGRMNTPALRLIPTGFCVRAWGLNATLRDLRIWQLYPGRRCGRGRQIPGGLGPANTVGNPDPFRGSYQRFCLTRNTANLRSGWRIQPVGMFGARRFFGNSFSWTPRRVFVAVKLELAWNSVNPIATGDWLRYMRFATPLLKSARCSVHFLSRAQMRPPSGRAGCGIS